jgi:hypothetical protein
MLERDRERQKGGDTVRKRQKSGMRREKRKTQRMSDIALREKKKLFKRD